MALLVQLILSNLRFAPELIPTACAAVLATVGMLVLRQTCKPFGLFRHILWWTMAAALVFCFTILRGFFDLTYGGWTEILALLGAMALAAVLYFVAYKAVQWLPKHLRIRRK